MKFMWFWAVLAIWVVLPVLAVKIAALLRKPKLPMATANFNMEQALGRCYRHGQVGHKPRTVSPPDGPPTKAPEKIVT